MVLLGGQSTMKGTMRTTKSTFIRNVLKTTTKPVRSLIKKMLGLMPILAGIACLTLVAGEAAAQRTAALSGVKEGIVLDANRLQDPILQSGQR